MSKSVIQKFDIFPDSYGNGLSGTQVREALSEATEVKPEDYMIIFQNGEIKTIKFSAVIEAIGAAGATPDGTIDANTYAIITE